MAFTQTDLESVEQAILALSNGQRVAVVEMDGNRVEYSNADLNKLWALRERIQSELSSAQGRRRFVLTTTSKGL